DLETELDARRRLAEPVRERADEHDASEERRRGEQEEDRDAGAEHEELFAPRATRGVVRAEHLIAPEDERGGHGDDDEEVARRVARGIRDAPLEWHDGAKRHRHVARTDRRAD